MNARRLVWAVPIGLVAAAPIISYFVFPDDFLPAFYAWIREHGTVGVLIFAVVYVVICVFLLAPGELVSAAAGFLFGAWGAPLAVISHFIAALIGFLISRYFLRARVKAWTTKHRLFAAIDAAAAEHSWVLVLLLRLNPLAPPNIQNYFFGATNIGLLPYSVATFFGIIPLTVAYVYLGAIGQTLVFEQGITSSKLALLCIGLIATAVAVYMMTRKVSQKLREMTTAQETIGLRPS